MNFPSRQISTLALSLLALAGSGCESTKVAPETVAESRIESLDTPFTVQRGTSAADLVKYLGEPQRKYPFEKHDVEAEVWVYERNIGADSELVIINTETRYYWDRQENDMVEYQEPVYGHQVSSNKEITEILLVDNAVSAWKRTTEGEETVAGNTR